MKAAVPWTAGKSVAPVLAEESVMPSFYANRNAQANGDHEVHKAGCAFMPLLQNSEYLGEFTSCEPAVAKAKSTYPRANGCYYCARECNTS